MTLDKVIEGRHSTRKFTDDPLPDGDLQKIVDAARWAPSADNSQPWHFLAIRDDELKDKIADIVKERAEKAAKIMKEIYVDGTREETNSPYCSEKPTAGTNPEKFLKFNDRFILFFRTAPVLMICYSDPYEMNFYNNAMRRADDDPEAFDEFFLKLSPQTQACGAAIEHMMLKAVDLGYGTCWQMGPVTAHEEIEKLLKDEYDFDMPGKSIVAIVPIGVPDGEQKSPKRKPVEEILTVI
ncbi:MAG: nitroreductase family protein [Anaerovoracaceae bacterium]|jgi:nitroreductase